MMTKKKKMIILGASLAVVLGLIVALIFILRGSDNGKDVTYTVSFDSNGGSYVESVTVKENEKVTKPANPFKEGYVFDEWLLDGAAYNFDAPVTKNITLLAKYNVEGEVEPEQPVEPETPVEPEEPTEPEKPEEPKVKYTITFETGTDAVIASQEVVENTIAKAPTSPKRTGYAFKGWYNGETKWNFTTKVTENVTLTAKWVKTYKVTFNSDGGSKVTAQTIEEGKIVTKPKDPTKETFKFVEWTLDGKAFDFKTKITDDITLKATWKEKAKYTITFVNEGQTVDTKTIYEGDVLGTLPTVKRDDYVFTGWFNGNTKYTAKTAITLKEGTNALTLTAKWTEVVHTYKYVVTKVDDYSTDRYISIYEDGKFISTPTQILFTNGSLLSKTKEDGKFVVGDADLDYLDATGNIKVKLASGKVVTASK